MSSVERCIQEESFVVLDRQVTSECVLKKLVAQPAAQNYPDHLWLLCLSAAEGAVALCVTDAVLNHTLCSYQANNVGQTSIGFGGLEHPKQPKEAHQCVRYLARESQP